MSYARDKFRRAIRELTGEGHIKLRLVNAYRNHLKHLEVNDLPENLQSDFINLRSKITMLEAEGEKGRVINTVESMSMSETKTLVELVTSMYENLVNED